MLLQCQVQQRQLTLKRNANQLSTAYTGTIQRILMTRICSFGREKYSRCIATSYIVTGRAIRTNIPDMNHAWYLTDHFDFLNSIIIRGRATNSPTAKRHHRIRNHLRRGHRQKAKALAIRESCQTESVILASPYNLQRWITTVYADVC